MSGEPNPRTAIDNVHFTGDVPGSADFNVYITRFGKKESELSLSEYYDAGSMQRRHLYESTIFSRIVASRLREAFAANVYEREMSLPLLDGIGAP